mmetsp:Transcript_179781/g.570213  ORF Transcript_179781/g.570213 Transcript_179781/m.570213 type:complete len:214 (-) Transcript_179781:43-684(-)
MESTPSKQPLLEIEDSAGPSLSMGSNTLSGLPSTRRSRSLMVHGLGRAACWRRAVCSLPRCSLWSSPNWRCCRLLSTLRRLCGTLEEIERGVKDGVISVEELRYKPPKKVEVRTQISEIGPVSTLLGGPRSTDTRKFWRCTQPSRWLPLASLPEWPWSMPGLEPGVCLWVPRAPERKRVPDLPGPHRHLRESEASRRCFPCRRVCGVARCNML